MAQGENRKSRNKGIIIPIVAGVAIAVAIGMVINTTVPRSSYAKDIFHPAQSVTIIIPQDAHNAEAGINYNPDKVTVVLGINNTVTWLNNDVVPDCIDASFVGTSNACQDDAMITPGKSWSYTFTEEGTYQYTSAIRPWLSGTILVKGEGLPQPLKPTNEPIYPEVTVIKGDLSYPVLGRTEEISEGGETIESFVAGHNNVTFARNQTKLWWSHISSADGKDVITLVITNVGNNTAYLETFGIAGYTTISVSEKTPVFYSYAVNSNYSLDDESKGPKPPIEDKFTLEPGQSLSAIITGKLVTKPYDIPITTIEGFATYQYDQESADHDGKAIWTMRTLRTGEQLPQ